MKDLNPETFAPADTSDFIGVAATVFDGLKRKIDQINAGKIQKGQRWLFVGSPGIGKTAAAIELARRLAGHPVCLETVNGQSCTVDLVRSWRDSQAYRPLYGHSVKLIDELDLASPAAQNELISVLDRLPPWQHYIATTNKNIEALQERIQTRFQQFQFEPPPVSQIAELLGRFRMTAAVAMKVASGARGNVRAALLDAQSVLDMAA